MDRVDRRREVQSVIRFFSFEHLEEGSLAREVSGLCCELVEDILDRISDSPELTNGFRKLLEAKDSFVRASLDEG